MTSTLIAAVGFLFLAVIIFANIVVQFTSQYFDIDKVRKEIQFAMATWGVAISMFIVYAMQTGFRFAFI